MMSRFFRHHLAFLALALVLAAFVAGVGGASLQEKLRRFQPTGMEAIPLGAGFLVERADEGVGLEAGDVILAVRGQTPETLEALERQLRAEPEAALLVRHAVGPEVGLDDVTYRRPPRQIDAVHLAVVAIGVFYLLIGLYTAFALHRSPVRDATPLDGREPRPGRRPVRAPAYRLFYLWCLTSAAFYVASPVLPPADAIDRLIFLVDQVSRSLLPALTLHLFLVFPTRLVEGRGRFALPAVYLPSALLLAFHADQAFAGGRWLFGPATAAQVAIVDRLELFLLVALSLLSAATLALRFLRRPGWEHRRQVQWILAGLVGGYTPFLLAYLLPWAVGLPTPTWSTLVGVLPLALVPLAFAWAIFRYRLLDLGVVLRDVASYAAAGIVAVFGFQIAQAAIESGVGGDTPLLRNMLTFAAGLAIAGVLVPTRDAVAGGLERLRQRGLWDRRRLLRDLGQELLHERDLDRLCATLVEHLEEGLIVRAELYLRQGPEALALTREQEGLPAILPLDALGTQLWERDVRAVSAIGLPGEEPSEEERLYAAGYRYALPVAVRDLPVAVVLLSYKYDEEPLDGEDLVLVRGLLDQAALAIENARLLDEVHHQLQEVSRLEAFNHGILESSPAGLAVIDAAGRVIAANRAFARVATPATSEALAPDAFVGLDVAELLPVRPLPEPEHGPIDVGWCTLDGAEHYLQLAVADYASTTEPTSGNDPATRRVLVVQDVGERVHLEHELQEKERLASLGMLAAGVAHEVNTPLTGISSYAQMLKANTKEGDPQRAILEKMERQTFRASQIVNNLLDFARNRRGEMGRLRLDRVAIEALHLLETRALDASVALEVESDGEPLLVLGSEAELHQVVTNLVANAIDALATHDGERRVTLRLDQTDRRARLRVADTGPGIPPERLEVIFKPFFSSKLGRGGTGLGLAITYNLVRRHGGEIRAENTDTGCVLTVELPRYQAITR